MINVFADLTSRKSVSNASVLGYSLVLYAINAHISKIPYTIKRKTYANVAKVL